MLRREGKKKKLAFQTYTLQASSDSANSYFSKETQLENYSTRYSLYLNTKLIKRRIKKEKGKLYYTAEQ